MKLLTGLLIVAVLLFSISSEAYNYLNRFEYLEKHGLWVSNFFLFTQLSLDCGCPITFKFFTPSYATVKIAVKERPIPLPFGAFIRT